MKRIAYTPKDLILTSGPSISSREVKYVTDAVTNGWNFHMDDYIRQFETAFAKYIGVKYALTVSSGTAALHLAMRSLNIGPGDEVIIADQSFISCANVVKWVGASPVFCDVEEDTWCMDPESFKKAISKKTKAVIPVYMYGQPPKMDEIRKIAKEINIFVVEDACPAVGSLYKSKKAGSLSDIGAFSFQGAKILVTGEGGMFVTNNKSYYEIARSLRTHGRDFNKVFWHKDIGYMYRMTNMQAALGLAQLERIDELVEKKRRIFEWYYSRLSKINGLRMNDINNWSKTNYWMSSIVLDDNSHISRDEICKALKENNIDTRPFFYPISMFSMYKDSKRVDTNVSYKLGLNGINLPSGVKLTKEKVNYIASQVIELLQ